MPSELRLRCLVLLIAVASPLLAGSPANAAVYYVRQTVGNDRNDGLSPQTAWKRLVKLWSLKAGDTAYVGPGLYRDAIEVRNDGTAEARITFIADNAGRYTGDPPGRVLFAGSEPVDEASFTPMALPGVYSLRSPGFPVLGVVEMDSSQFRYQEARRTREHLVDKLTELQVVEKLRSHFYYDEKGKTLYIHTSDDRPPRSHEIELFKRGYGVMVNGKAYVTVIGFTFRHMGDSGINFFKGSSHGIALFNTAYGSRQGIRVFTATDVLVQGNVFFRNENSGVYFASGSVNGSAIRNVSYENIKGLRWGSKSGSAVATENTAFENRDAGIFIEDVGPAIVLNNRLGKNLGAQLTVLQSAYSSDGNCFERGGEQLLADFFPHPREHRFKTLREYQEARRQDLGSRETGCGAWPEKVDVHKLHAESLAYRDRALKTLAAAADEPSRPAVTPVRGPTPQHP
jgi:hypothetical protein